MFFKNWDALGKWKIDGLRTQREEFIQTIKIKLGLIPLDSLTCEEARQFVHQLDLIVDSNNNRPTITEYQNALKTSHSEGCLLLNADNGKLLTQHHINIKKKIQKENIDTMSLTKLRYYTKRLGIHKCTTLNKTILLNILKNIIKRKKRTRSTQNHIPLIEPITKKLKLLSKNKIYNDKEEMTSSDDDDCIE